MKIRTIQMRTDKVLYTKDWHGMARKIFGADVKYVYTTRKFRVYIYKNLLV